MGRFTLKTERNNFTITLSPVDLKFQPKVYNVVLNRANLIFKYDQGYKCSPLNLYSIDFVLRNNMYEDELSNDYTYSEFVTIDLHHILGKPLHYRISEDPTFSDTEWKEYHPWIGFMLSEGDGLKVIYAQIRNEYKASDVCSISVTKTTKTTI